MLTGRDLLQTLLCTLAQQLLHSFGRRNALSFPWPGGSAATAAARQKAPRDQVVLGRLAPYLERDCLRSLTPCVSSDPRTM